MGKRVTLTVGRYVFTETNGRWAVAESGIPYAQEPDALHITMAREIIRLLGEVEFYSSRHPLSDQRIEEIWPGSDPDLTRTQFNALMKQLQEAWGRSFPKHLEVFAKVTAEKALELPERVALLQAALAGLPEHWRQWQWRADEKQVFGERYVRSVHGDNGHGMGRQAIAVVPADKYYFGTVADFIAAANPDTLTMLLAERQSYVDPKGLFAAGVWEAVKWVEKRRDDYIREHGSYDPETGATEFPDDGEYVSELDEIVEGLQKLAGA